MRILNGIFYYSVVFPLSILPFWILYGFSDFIYFLFYYVIGYRKGIVMQNIRNSFPDKTNAEHKKIAKKFYAHFCDLILESLKMFTISETEAKARMIYRNNDAVNKYFDQGKSLIIAMGHYANWEFTAVTVDAAVRHQTVAIYKPLTNAYFDNKVRVSRMKYGLRMMHNRTVKEDFEKQKNELTATFFLIDQSPSAHSRPYWTTFLHQQTAVLTGTEKYSTAYNYPVLYLRQTKLKRGYYAGEFVDVINDPSGTTEGEITEKVTRLLEKDIIDRPEFWLWSHKRWKQRPDAPSINNSVKASDRSKRSDA